MTSASELFYNRRSRFGRSSDQFDVGSGLGSPPPLDRTNRRHRHFNSSAGGSHTRRGGDRVDLDGCDPLRRAVHHHRPPHRPSHPPQERESIHFEEGGHQFSSGNVSHSGNHSDVRDRSSSNGNDRLPGSVLLARERLMQRLRGVTLSGSRRSNRSTSRNHQNDITIRDDFRLVDYGDWETEISSEWLSSISPLTDSINQQMTKRPPGLTQDAMNSLHVEVFCVPKENEEEDGMSKALRVCSICLESFSEGDELVRLPCEHRYHFCCLDPWVRTCGDCPYCRRGICVISDS